VSALLALPAPLLTLLAFLMVGAVIALVAWALQLMQAANDRREFSLMLAGCMVCSAAVGLATVMVLTFTTPGRLQASGLLLPPVDAPAEISLDRLALGWDPLAPRSAPLP
jgi:uncharacterized membrane protein